jgi:hypothetical protein
MGHHGSASWPWASSRVVVTRSTIEVATVRRRMVNRILNHGRPRKATEDGTFNRGFDREEPDGSRMLTTVAFQSPTL